MGVQRFPRGDSKPAIDAGVEWRDSAAITPDKRAGELLVCHTSSTAGLKCLKH